MSWVVEFKPGDAFTAGKHSGLCQVVKLAPVNKAFQDILLDVKIVVANGREPVSANAPADIGSAISAGLVISTCATPYIYFPNKVLLAVPGPRSTTKPTAPKTTLMPDRYAAWDNAGLKSSIKCWMDRMPYNPELHHLNQVKHGSWVFRFQGTSLQLTCVKNPLKTDRTSF